MNGRKPAGSLLDCSVQRADAHPKAAGLCKYIADMEWPGMLFAGTLRSTKARAVITSIEIPELPHGYSIVDKKDVPGKNRVRMLVDDQPFFAEEEVKYIGEPILLVAGPDRETVASLLSRINVQYEDREAIDSVSEAAEGRKTPLYGDDNLFANYQFGAAEREMNELFSEAAFVFEDEYSTGYQEQLYMEPQGVVGLYDGNRITVYGSMQCPYYVKKALIQGLGWDGERIRVVQTVTGGAFGGKEDYPSILAGHAAFAALKTGKPVQIILDRQEDITVTPKRHPSVIHFKTALDSEDIITAMEIHVTLDGGAYAGLTDVVLQRAMFAATGVYRVPNVRVTGKAFATNSVPAGAFRGFGGPQAFFGIEMHMHQIAIRRGRDPLAFKRRHMVEKGDATVTGGTYRQEVKLDRMTEILLDLTGYERNSNGKPGDEQERPEYPPTNRGIGFSLFFHGAGFTGSGEKKKIKARVKLERRKDGLVEILVSSVEMGQGAQTTLRKIVAEKLEIPMESVLYENPDTDRVPDSGPTVASRTVMIVGSLLAEASNELNTRGPGDQVVLVEYRQPEGIEWDQDNLIGDAYPAYSWGANAVEVEIDPITFEIRVTGIWGVYDVGRAIDEKIVLGQIEGGMVQGLGYAGLEVMERKKGKILQTSVTDYIIPTSLDLPPAVIQLIDNPYENGPFGAKGAGELPHIGVAPAFAAAVQNALNRPVRKIPVTPEYLMEITEQ
jgi:CO/xanthine dehydrogenase Mo-binding subunit